MFPNVFLYGVQTVYPMTTCVEQIEAFLFAVQRFLLYSTSPKFPYDFEHSRRDLDGPRLWAVNIYVASITPYFDPLHLRPCYR